MPNILILDDQTQGVLYGYAVLDAIKQSNKGQLVKQYVVPAEAYIAFLQTVYSEVPEVKIYLQAVEIEGINPRQSKLLRAVDDVLDINPEDWEKALKLCGLEFEP